MTYFCTLASGSSGNCCLYVSDSVRILIDAGTTAKYITAALAKLGLTPTDLTHILVTHGHSDHIGALPVLLKRTGAQVCCTWETAGYIRFPEGCRPRIFMPGERLDLPGCPVQTFATPHDICGSCGFVLGEGECRVAVCTDLGEMTGEIFSHLQGSRLVYLESNHDEVLLKNGPYPYPLKLRILSDRGHLSNEACGQVVVRLVRTGTNRLILAHLSKENNHPRLALETTLEALRCAGLTAEVTVAAAAEPGDPVLL
jgi:phosphoribosyl 1,2-cyclic phosphodiesterase